MTPDFAVMRELYYTNDCMLVQLNTSTHFSFWVTLRARNKHIKPNFLVEFCKSSLLLRYCRKKLQIYVDMPAVRLDWNSGTKMYAVVTAWSHVWHVLGVRLFLATRYNMYEDKRPMTMLVWTLHCLPFGHHSAKLGFDIRNWCMFRQLPLRLRYISTRCTRHLRFF